jgi:hypothetical protein
MIGSHASAAALAILGAGAAILAPHLVRAEQSANPAPIRLVTLDPGHFHAALVQKFMYDGVDARVHVYAPGGDDWKTSAH